MTEKARIIRAEFVTSATNWQKALKRGDVPDLPQVCFAGRSNVGKSSLLNALTARRTLARVSRTPGRTQLLNAFQVTLRTEAGEHDALFVDLPGYGFANAPASVRAQWKPMMESYLKDNPHLRACCLLLDLRHEPNAGDVDMAEQLEEWEVPLLPIATKADKVGSTQRRKHVKAIAEVLGIEPGDLRLTSAEKKQGIAELAGDIAFVTGEEANDGVGEGETPLQ